MKTDEDIFVLIPFNTFMVEEEAEADKDATHQMGLENIDCRASVKEKQNRRKNQ